MKKMWLRWLVLGLLFGVAVHAEEVTVYYDYIEDGVLKGGKLRVERFSKLGSDLLGAVMGVGAGGNNWRVSTIVDNGPSNNRIDLVMLGDGYTESELGAYAAQVNNVIAAFFSQEPLRSYRQFFNVHRVDVISNESGVDEPEAGIFRDTSLDMAYDCGGIARLLCVNTNKATNAAALARDVDLIMVLANSDRYGGAGYPSILTVAGRNETAVEIAIHEAGHSIANLGDEYFTPGTSYTGPELVEPNISIHDSQTQVAQNRKWYRWMDVAGVGSFEGGGYHEFGIYRPTVQSKMRALGRPFGVVNTEQFILSFYETVSPVDDASPRSNSTFSSGSSFSVRPSRPSAFHRLDIQWSVNNAPVPGATGEVFIADCELLPERLNTISVIVIDSTNRVRDEGTRNSRMRFARSWRVESTGCPGEFLRGDCNEDGDLDITDAIFGLTYLFVGGETPSCIEACNTNRDGDHDLTDAIYLLYFLFTGGEAPPAPWPVCAVEPTLIVGCEEFDCG